MRALEILQAHVHTQSQVRMWAQLDLILKGEDKDA